MQVQQLMTPAPRACRPDTTLCEVVQMMWEGDFGVLPVTDQAGRVSGILTDRDISIALGTRNRTASALRAADVMSRNVQTCREEDDIKAALQSMKEHRVRRLPVVNAEGRLCGMLSLNDAVLGADGSLPAADVLEVLRGVCVHRKPSGDALVAAA